MRKYLHVGLAMEVQMYGQPDHLISYLQTIFSSRNALKIQDGVCVPPLPNNLQELRQGLSSCRVHWHTYSTQSTGWVHISFGCGQGYLYAHSEYLLVDNKPSELLLQTMQCWLSYLFSSLTINFWKFSILFKYPYIVKLLSFTKLNVRLVSLVNSFFYKDLSIFYFLYCPLMFIWIPPPPLVPKF
jgi:hypothetical protein